MLRARFITSAYRAVAGQGILRRQIALGLSYPGPCFTRVLGCAPSGRINQNCRVLLCGEQGHCWSFLSCSISWRWCPTITHSDPGHPGPSLSNVFPALWVPSAFRPLFHPPCSIPHNWPSSPQYYYNRASSLSHSETLHSKWLTHIGLIFSKSLKWQHMQE